MTRHDIALKALSILRSCGHIRYVNDGVQVHRILRCRGEAIKSGVKHLDHDILTIPRHSGKNMAGFEAEDWIPQKSSQAYGLIAG